MTKKKVSPEIDQDDPQHKIVIDWKEFEKLCWFQCTEQEIADWFGCGMDTLESRIKEYYNGLTFSEVFRQKKGTGKISLRRAQFQKAVKDGNVTMQIWLGKQMLGQKDKQEIEHTVIGIDVDKAKKKVLKALGNKSD